MNEEMVRERMSVFPLGGGDSGWIPINDDRIHLTMRVPLPPWMKVVYATPEQWKRMELRSLRENLSLRISWGDRRSERPRWGTALSPHGDRKRKAQKAEMTRLIEKYGIEFWY